MNRIHLATLGITLGLGTLAGTALAQSTPRSDFGPTPPADTQSQTADFSPAPPAGTVMQEPQGEPAEAPATQSQTYAPAQAYAPAQPMELAPPPATRAADADAHSRRAAPDAPPPSARRDPNPQSGPHIGHGLFNNYGPNDFGA